MTQDIREDVRKKYAQAITNKLSCCGAGAYHNPITGNLYESNEIEGFLKKAKRLFYLLLLDLRL